MSSYNANKFRGVSRFENIRPTVSSTASTKRKLTASNENTFDTKKRKLNPFKPFNDKCNLLIELLKLDDCEDTKKYSIVIERKKYLYINSKMDPETFSINLKNIYKNHKYIQCNLILNNQIADFTQTFNKFKYLNIIKSLLSEIIISPCYSIYNIKLKPQHVSQLLKLINTIKFKSKDEKFISLFKKVAASKKDEKGTDVIELDFTSALKKFNTNHIVQGYRKQLINIVKLQEKAAENRVKRTFEKREILKLRKQRRLEKAKEKPTNTDRMNVVLPVEAKTETRVVKTQHSDVAAEVVTKAQSVNKVEEKLITHINDKNVLSVQEIFKYSLLTINKTITSLNNIKKLKPYKVVKTYVKLPITLYDNSSLNELKNTSKYSTNIIILSYINVSVSDSYFTDDLNVDALAGDSEREFKVLSIGGGINDSLRTLTDIKRDLMTKIKSYNPTTIN